VNLRGPNEKAIFSDGFSMGLNCHSGQLRFSARGFGFYLNFHNLLALVVTASGAHVVRHGVVTAVGARHRELAEQLMMLAGTTETFA
jgi:hypothetical protein